MKQLFTLLLLAFLVNLLPAQQMYQHPVITLLGSDMDRMPQLNSGAFGYQGLGLTRFRETNNFLITRNFQVYWLPFSPLTNGFGRYQLGYGHRGLLLSQAPGQTDLSGGYQWQISGRLYQNLGFQSRWRRQSADDNKDGFNDYQNGRHHFLIHNMYYYGRGWNLTLHNSYLNSNRHQGQLGYNWKEHAGGDSLYGYGTATQQWRSYFMATKGWGYRELTIIANAQAHDEEGHYGQRSLRNQENRQEFTAIFKHQRDDFQSQASLLLSRQELAQHWDDWRDQRDWIHFQFGGHHEQFIHGNLIAKAQVQLDYHSMTDWQLMPNLRLDYLGVKKLRLSLMGGRDYRLPRLLEEQQAFLVSQRQWLLDTYGADRLWYGAASAQSDIYHIASFRQQLKLTYRVHHFNQLHLVDPSVDGLVTGELLQDNIPLQHLLMASLQTNLNRWRWTSTYRFRDIPLPYQIKEQQQFLESKHSTFNSINYLRRANGDIKQQWDLRFHHLWRSPQPLPNGTKSPQLHDLRIHLETGRKINRKWNDIISLFVGVENLLDQQQTDVFQNPDTPFGLGFDGSSAWGSPIGRRFYAGVRWQP